MRINKGRNRLRVERRKNDGASPMESLANLVDVMLVFACGLIIALIAAHNVDQDPIQSRQHQGKSRPDTENQGRSSGDGQNIQRPRHREDVRY